MCLKVLLIVVQNLKSKKYVLLKTGYQIQINKIKMGKSSVTIVQSIFIPFIFILAYVSGILPNRIPWCKQNKIFMCLANAFSGGVFLALAIMHILPEVSDTYDEWKGEDSHEEHEEEHEGEHEEHDHDHSFSLPFFLVFVGYALILFIDKVLFNTHSLLGSHGHDHGGHSKNINAQKESSHDAPLPDEELDRCGSRNHCFVSKMSEVLKVEDAKEEDIVKVNKVSDVGKVDIPYLNDQEIQKNQKSKQVSDGIEIQEPKKEVKYDKMKLFNLSSITLMIGLSAHSVFEGIVVGLEDELKDLWSVIIAIILHKWAAAMSLGISMNHTLKDQKGLIYILLGVFSIATPLGVGIGMLVSGESEITSVIFNSLAAGTFIFIACSEIISEEFENPNNKFLKMGVFTLGAGFILGIGFIET